MRAERIVLSFVAVLFGLLVAGGAYYVYEHYVKTQPQKEQTVTIKVTPSPTPSNPADYLTVDQPADQTVSSQRTITVSGKATPNSEVVISTPSTDQAGVASNDGSFSLTISLDDDTNPLYVTAIFPDGTQQQVQKTVTYSTAAF